MIERKPGDCWIWQGRLNNTGYGRFCGEYAHRFAWRMENGPVPDGLYVCHKCDMPACVNPFHLFVGDAQDNMTDMARKGRKGKISPAQVRDLRAAYKEGADMAKVAADLGISYSNALRIAKGHARKHVP